MGEGPAPSWCGHQQLGRSVRGGSATIQTTRFSFDPIEIYATKRELNEFINRLETMGVTENGERQAMMSAMVKNTYINNLENVSTDMDRMHMDPEFRYQQHTLDSDVHHLNSHMIGIVQIHTGRCNQKFPKADCLPLFSLSIKLVFVCNQNGNIHRAWCANIRTPIMQGNF
jgi:hypothetical protein